MLHLDPTEPSCDAKKQTLVYCCWKEMILNLLSSHLTELIIPVAHSVKNGNLLHCSCLENPMDRGAWWAIQSVDSQRVGDD